MRVGALLFQFLGYSTKIPNIYRIHCNESSTMINVIRLVHATTKKDNQLLII
jgi:hypothetical protein